MSARTQGKNEQNESDSRYFPRWEVNNRVLYRLENDALAHEGTTKDLSCAGACLTVDKKHSPNQKIKLTVYLSDATKINLNGNIVWTKELSNEVQIGITFHSTPEQAQDLILQHAFEIDQDKVVKNWFKGWNKKT